MFQTYYTSRKLELQGLGRKMPGQFHKNHHAGAAPAQIGMKTETAKFPVFCYNSLERGTLQSTVGRVVRNSPVAKAV